MKNISVKSVLAFLCLTCVAASCSLEETPTSFVSPDEYFQTEAQCKASVNGTYIYLKSIYSSNFMTCVEDVTDLMAIQTNNDNARLKISPSNPGFGADLWLYGYRTIMRCNATIYGIEHSPVPVETQKPLVAETKIVRAFYYWLLTSFFGDVPFYTERVSDVETMRKIAALGRTPANEIRSFCIKDLQECIMDLPQERFSSDPEHRMGAACGWMLIGKMAQWNKEWDTAIDAVSHLEQIYGDFSQYPLSDVLFRCKNTDESIFEVQRTYTPGGLSVTHNTAAISTPVHSGTTYLYDGVEIRELGNTATTWTSMRPTDYFFNSLQPRRGNDKRAAINMAWEYDGKPFKSATSRPWMGPKFWCPNFDQTADHNNNRIFRYADALLMQAENYAETDQPEKAVTYLNMIRGRAGTGDYVFKTKALLLNEIQRERGRELIGEWQRKFDLVRWGIWYESVRDNCFRKETVENLRPCHQYYPIPDKQVGYSGGALDNKEYAKYGL